MFIDLIKCVTHVEEKIFDTIKSSDWPVALFGAGEMSGQIIKYLRSHEIEPMCICDNDVSKHGTYRLGLPVCGYHGFRSEMAHKKGGCEYHMVVSVGEPNKDSVFAYLAKQHEENNIWYLRGYEECGTKIDYRYVKDRSAEFEEAYGIFEDDRSRDVFVNVLNARLSGEFALYRDVMSTSQYFDEEIVQLSANEVFLDVGAYKGDGIIEFVKCTRAMYDGVIALEPDSKTLCILRDTLAFNNINKVELHNKGAWSECTKLFFCSGRSGNFRISETDEPSADSGASLEVDTIDNVMHGRRVTYVSMDVEGAEHNAILGAENTIKQWKPRLAISAYHRREDLFDLPLLLRSFVPEYKFYLRHYTTNHTETVLYAV